MSKGGGTQTQTVETALDPRSQAAVDAMRRQAASGAQTAIGTPGSFVAGQDPRSIEQIVAEFMNPFISSVVDGTRGEFDHLRGQAQVGVNQSATQAGAFGGDRHGVAQGVRLGELDRAQGSQIAGLLSGGFQNALSTGLQQSELSRLIRQQQLQEPLFRQQMAQQFLQGGLGPTSGSTTQTTQLPGSNVFGNIAGLGLTLAGGGFNPFGFLGGGGGSGLGSFFGAQQMPTPQFLPRAPLPVPGRIGG